MTTNIKNKQSTNMIPLPLPPPPPTTRLEQTSPDDSDVLQPSSLPSPPQSIAETVKPNRPPPFPPPGSSSSSSTRPFMEAVTRTVTPSLFEDLEQFVVNTTRNEETLLTGAAPPPPPRVSNTLPRTVAYAAATASQIPNHPSVHLGDDDFTFEANDFIILEDDDPGPISPPTSPHSFFPDLGYTSTS